METLVNTKEKDLLVTARPVAPEDLRLGDFVCIHQLFWEHLNCASLSDADWRQPRLIKLQWLPFSCEPPRKIVALSLPFVLLRNFERKHEMLDVRRYGLARVPKQFGRTAFKCLRQDKERDPKTALGRLGIL